MRYDNKGHQVLAPGTEDPRYTVRLYMIRAERPRYWNFHCIYCGNKLCELNGTVVYMADISSEGISSTMGNQIRCNSRQCSGRAWFAFEF